MAQRVLKLLIDDIDGGEADETVTFALDGKFYEIDLSNENATLLRTLLEPYRRKGRRAGTGNLRATGTVTFPTRTAKATVTNIDDSAEVRAWAARYALPANERGRVKAELRNAYRAFKRDDREPLRTLLKENNLDPTAADTDPETIFAKPEAPKEKPVEDRSRLTAKKATGVSSAQLTRLRKANADEDGQYISDGRDITSCEPLVRRGLFTKIEDRVYQITPAGRLWFEVHGIDPDLPDV